ncbi:MAG: hypothetical protein AAFY20_19750 [Cyanobacteria bacterium J06639_14]
MKVVQTMQVRNMSFVGWIEPYFNIHKVALKNVRESNSIWQQVRQYGSIVSEFEVDIVLMLMVALRYLSIIMMMRYFWLSLNP